MLQWGMDASGASGGIIVKRSRFFSALCIGCTLLISSQSWAAIIEPGSGDLTINHGQGFKPITSRASANVGDSVMVGPGGSATVVYDDGCKVNVQPGAVTAIAPLSPCASGSNAQDWSSWGWQNIVFWGLFIGTGVFIGIEASRTGNHAASP
jgi:hypothetical protein